MAIETPEVTQKNWAALAETLSKFNERVTKLEEREGNRDRFIQSQADEIKRLNGVIVALKMGNGPTT